MTSKRSITVKSLSGNLLQMKVIVCCNNYAALCCLLWSYLIPIPLYSQL